MKDKFEFTTDSQSAVFCEKIAVKMVDLFGITSDEAIGRLSRDWRGLQLLGPNDIIYHEDEEYWAKTYLFPISPIDATGWSKTSRASINMRLCGTDPFIITWAANMRTTGRLAVIRGVASVKRWRATAVRDAIAMQGAAKRSGVPGHIVTLPPK